MNKKLVKVQAEFEFEDDWTEAEMTAAIQEVLSDRPEEFIEQGCWIIENVEKKAEDLVRVSA